MPLLSWNEDLSVKIQQIDDQHKNLILILNNLHDAMKKGQSQKVMGDILNELIDYTQYHFDFEEKLLKQHNFTGFKGHQEEHQKLTHQVLEFKEKFINNESFISISLVTFLQEWISHHILLVDKSYTDFLHQKGIQ